MEDPPILDVHDMNRVELQAAFIARTHEDQFRAESGVSEKRRHKLPEHVLVWYGYEALRRFAA